MERDRAAKRLSEHFEVLVFVVSSIATQIRSSFRLCKCRASEEFRFPRKCKDPCFFLSLFGGFLPFPWECRPPVCQSSETFAIVRKAHTTEKCNIMTSSSPSRNVARRSKRADSPGHPRLHCDQRDEFGIVCLYETTPSIGPHWSSRATCGVKGGVPDYWKTTPRQEQRSK